MFWNEYLKGKTALEKKAVSVKNEPNEERKYHFFSSAARDGNLKPMAIGKRKSE